MSASESDFTGPLKALEGQQPKNLINRANLEAEERGDSASASDLADLLDVAAADDLLLNRLGMLVHGWDVADPSLPWAASTLRSTPERRALICKLLGMDERGAALLLLKRPIFHDETVVITAPWERWYTPERAEEHGFYWPRYRDYLLGTRGWPESSVTALNLATDQVLERLTDPTRQEAHQSKGLVVGYVQSGKTANFTGVIAKAIDAGYRLIIVMTGTIELLRSQTQRRLDMEMVGQQNILGDIPVEDAALLNIDYADDEAWLSGQFLDLGAAPNSEIVRLTRHKTDYKGLGAQFKALKMERAVPALPLYRPENLFKAQTRLAIVKKNAARLRQLVKDIKFNHKAFAEIPVLIIDDESDEASINTVDPDKVRKAKEAGNDVKERRAINQCIADLLELMPRAQYVGYTATPFANVFVDPSDPLTIFPRDFVISLPRPPGYMGVDDFHDQSDLGDGTRTIASSNELAFVRDLESEEDDKLGQERELHKVIDTFVLSGAVKLFREQVAPSLPFRHHTMLAHHSVKTDQHKELADTIRKVWTDSQYSSPAGKQRLRKLYEVDLLPVSQVRAEVGIPVAPPFDELVPFIAQAIQRITEVDNNPVLIVNSDKDIEQQTLDFDKHRTWRILVGGSKLSRGFTVEGLTVTYFRRATNMSSSLAQMGRWFGFRRGYGDLVRLFIARRARFGKKEVDLYEAFAGVAMDESAFRDQLQMYAEWDGDEPRVVPAQIPPLVTQHLPWLKPVARNKMFNAVLEEQAQAEFKPTGYPNHVDQMHANLEVWRPVLEAVSEAATVSSGGAGDYPALVGIVSAQEVIQKISESAYLPGYRESTVLPSVRFLERIHAEGLLEDFLVVSPQPAKGTSLEFIQDVGQRRVIVRSRRANRGGLFGEITDPKHRPAVQELIAGGPDSSLADLWTPTRGALILYLLRDKVPDYEETPKPKMRSSDAEYGVVVAWTVFPPQTAVAGHRGKIRFRVRNPEQSDQPVVEVPPGSSAT